MLPETAIYTIKNLVDPKELLLFLGFTINYENSKELRGPCAIHGGDNKTAFCFMKDTRRFYCFSHGCERDEDGSIHNDIIDLVMKKMLCSFKDAVEMLADLVGVDISSLSEDDIEAERVRLQVKREKATKANLEGENVVLPEIDRSILESYKKNGCPYFESIGIPNKIIEYFELGTMIDRFGIERATIPIYDEKGRLVSISGRRTDNDDEPRYILTNDFNKRRVLYGFDKVLKLPYAERQVVIVVEGFKALWHLYSAGIRNVVAIMGRVISREQLNLLSANNVEKVLLLLDGDDPGRKGAEESVVVMRGKMDSEIISLPDGMSPDDLPFGDLVGLLTLFA